MDTLGRIRTRGDSDFTVDDFNSMPYLLAVTKVCQRPAISWRELTHSAQEILRVYPVALEITRAAKDDNVLPLSKPVVGVSGKVYNELPILAGTIISVSTVGYNLYVRSLYLDLVKAEEIEAGFFPCRNKDIWGPDAYEFRPERWFNMNEKPELPIGVYGNLCVTRFYYGHSRAWGRKLRSLLVAFPSPVVPGIASDGDSRKYPHSAFQRGRKRIH